MKCPNCQSTFRHQDKFLVHLAVCQPVSMVNNPSIPHSNNLNADNYLNPYPGVASISEFYDADFSVIPNDHVADYSPDVSIIPNGCIVDSFGGVDTAIPNITLKILFMLYLPNYNFVDCHVVSVIPDNSYVEVISEPAIKTFVYPPKNNAENNFQIAKSTK